MPQPIICLDEEVCHFAERFGSLFSKPQYQYFVIVLLGLIECEGRRTLSAVLREVGQSPSMSGLSRFLAVAPWSHQDRVSLLHHGPDLHADRPGRRTARLAGPSAGAGRSH